MKGAWNEDDLDLEEQDIRWQEWKNLAWPEIESLPPPGVPLNSSGAERRQSMCIRSGTAVHGPDPRRSETEKP